MTFNEDKQSWVEQGYPVKTAHILASLGTIQSGSNLPAHIQEALTFFENLSSTQDIINMNESDMNNYRNVINNDYENYSHHIRNFMHRVSNVPMVQTSEENEISFL